MVKHWFRTALKAAQVAGDYILQSQSEIGVVDYKGRADLVTQVDKTSEQIIVHEILTAFPNHQILAEENSHTQSDNEVRWIIDPLDGTTNYVHGYPHFAVSIAVEYRGNIKAGIVYAPGLNELYSAMVDAGAYLNKTRINVSHVSQLSSALLSTGFPYEISPRWHRTMDQFRHLYSQTHGIRRDGSAALDLCYVAAGRYDGFWEYDLKPWDVAAGIMIVREANGHCTNLDNGEVAIDEGIIVATNGVLHELLLKALESSYQSDEVSPD